MIDLIGKKIIRVEIIDEKIEEGPKGCFDGNMRIHLDDGTIIGSVAYHGDSGLSIETTDYRPNAATVHLPGPVSETDLVREMNVRILTGADAGMYIARYERASIDSPWHLIKKTPFVADPGQEITSMDSTGNYLTPQRVPDGMPFSPVNYTPGEEPVERLDTEAQNRIADKGSP